MIGAESGNEDNVADTGVFGGGDRRTQLGGRAGIKGRGDQHEARSPRQGAGKRGGIRVIEPNRLSARLCFGEISEGLAYGKAGIEGGSNDRAPQHS